MIKTLKIVADIRGFGALHCKLKLISEKMNIFKKSGTFDFDYGT